MRELTYSQGLVIEDPLLLATLCVFCGKIWLPESGAGEAMEEVLTAVGDPWGGKVLEALRSDPTPYRIANWQEEYSILFAEGVLQRLPRSIRSHHGVNAHRTDFEGKTIEEVYGSTKPIYERLALRYHLTRADLPGIEFFDAGVSKARVDLAGSLFHLQLPQISAEPGKILELREVAQKSDIKQFWEMIEEHTRYAEAHEESSLARAEKIRRDFKEWSKDRWKFRGKSLYVGFLTTMVWFSSAFAPFATFAAADWVGELNRWWAQRKEKENQAFKCISRIDAKLKKLT